MTKLKTAFPWFGGKSTGTIQNAILKALPNHKRYVEPFGGGASILIAKEPSEVEVYNDVNRGLVNFFRVISDVDSFGKFMARTILLPVSRELYEEYARTWPGIHDPVEQAIRWFIVARQSFGGSFGNSWGTTINSTSNGMAQTTGSWKSALNRLPRSEEHTSELQSH